VTVDVYITDDLANDNVDSDSGDCHDDGMFLLGYFTTLFAVHLHSVE
jgi:hypothetical protein